MKRVTRFAVVLGASLAVSAPLGAVPAMAAGTGATGSAVAQVQQRPWDDDDDDVQGYYRTLRICERVGWLGERRDRWEDYDCDRVRRGPHRGMWELTVERDRDWWDHRDDDRRGRGRN